ncbi:MAG TPA: CpsB/CapC family capsule biosynthesis tyrosine phosphatase [Gemmatimonadales bacterium]|nr:CpsB/CapC family capsule biosynthesis tyrosine phosphatase [Gemmatimonadales bacterium]
MIDLHCHLLPGVDDGSRSLEQSVRVLEAMREGGVTAVCLTPHHSMGRLAAGRGVPASHDTAFERLSARAPDAIALYRGVELMLDRPVTAELLEHPGLRLGNTRYLLVEFTPALAVPAVSNALRQISELGLLPLLAHPERYTGCRPETVREWKAAGAVMQVDATTLLLTGGRGQRARELLAHGLADIIAADNHGDDRMLGTAYRYLCEHDGEQQADLLTRGNPAAILAEEPLEPVPPLAIKLPLFDRLKQLLGEQE